jgi:hypothetical protein
MIIDDHHAVARKHWLRQQHPPIAQQSAQSDFEKSLAFRVTLLVAVFVIGLNLLSPDPTPNPPTRAAVRHTV